MFFITVSNITKTTTELSGGGSGLREVYAYV